MVTINLNPTLFHLGAFAFSWYGLAVAAGILAGVWLLLRETQRRGLPTEPVLDLVLWIAVGGLAGARLLYILDRWPFFVANPAQILAIHTGGLSIMGAILGGGLTGALLARRKGLPARRLFDAAAPWSCAWSGDWAFRLSSHWRYGWSAY